jgi:cytochrome oxidase Cu insertion factor (SCO1/SenC/PrrC family)
MDRFKLYRFLASSKPVRSRGSASFFLIVFATVLLAVSGCNRSGEESGAYPVNYQTSSLPDVTLTDQYGQHVPLASLKGKPLLFDFIYTSCPGPCQLLTQHMKLIADKLGPALGPKVSMVSVTVDPEHDRSSRLLDYAKAFNANLKGWYFLTGSPTQIDELMRGFRLERSRWRRRDRSRFGIFSGRPAIRQLSTRSRSIPRNLPATLKKLPPATL